MESYLHRGLDARFNEYPVLEVLIDLGIMPRTIDGGLVGALETPVLDIGCGKHGKLVEHLRLSGLESEGIDPELLDEFAAQPYFMKGTAEKIPRGDGHYGTAVSHMSLYQSGMILPAFTFPEEKNGSRVKAFKEFYREAMKPELMSTLKEVERVLMPGGKFIIYPNPSLWIVDAASELKSRGYMLESEDLPQGFNPLPPEMEEVGFEYRERLILLTPNNQKPKKS
jgi:hypothetical protein